MRTARIVRDANAIVKGRVIERAENKVLGRIVGRVLRGMWR